MLFWLLAVALCIVVWGALWKRNLVLAFGVLIGVLLAWLLSYPLKPYVTGMESIPVWLPPLPLATIAIVLFIYGGLVWFRGNEALSKKKPDDSDSHH